MSAKVSCLLTEAMSNVSSDLNGLIEDLTLIPDKDTFVSIYNAAVEESGTFEIDLKKSRYEEKTFIVAFYKGMLLRLKEIEKANWIKARKILDYEYDDLTMAMMACANEVGFMYDTLLDALNYEDFWDEIDYAKDYFGLANVVSEDDEACESVERLLCSNEHKGMVIISTTKVEKLS